VCCACQGAISLRRNYIVLCDGCDLGWHQKCMVPVMSRVPVGEWHCSQCSEERQEARQGVQPKRARAPGGSGNGGSGNGGSDNGGSGEEEER
jgi:hypothetical protein